MFFLLKQLSCYGEPFVIKSTSYETNLQYTDESSQKKKKQFRRRIILKVKSKQIQIENKWMSISVIQHESGTVSVRLCLILSLK